MNRAPRMKRRHQSQASTPGLEKSLGRKKPGLKKIGPEKSLGLKKPGLEKSFREGKARAAHPNIPVSLPEKIIRATCAK